jgi:thiol-disulfide isomerase/thioredoxin
MKSTLLRRFADAYHRERLLTLAVILFALAFAEVVAASTVEPWRGGPPPPLSMRDLSGNVIALGQYRGHVVVVNFWATWCAPCVEELPSLELLRERFRKQGLEVLTVNYQENAARIAPFLERLGIELPVVRDHDGSVRTAWGVTLFPTTFVIGPDQNVAFVVVGAADWTAASYVARIRDLLPRPPKPFPH